MSAERLTTFVTRFTDELVLYQPGRSTMLIKTRYAPEEQEQAQEGVMKLQWISSAVVVYTALAVACICYAGV